jgi:hypothetical protein
MRNGISESLGAVPFDVHVLENLKSKGYKYVQIKGLTTDKHYDYIEPSFLLLVPLIKLPSDQNQKDIYEPIMSPILEQWATEAGNHLEVIIAPII